MPIMLPMMKAMGLFHNLDVGTKRYVDGVLGKNEMAAFKSGTFVASKKGTSGPVMDQSKMHKAQKYGEIEKQDAVYAAAVP